MSVTTAMVYNSTTGLPERSQPGDTMNKVERTYDLLVDYTNATTVLTNVFTFPVVNGNRYKFRAVMTSNVSSGNGMRVAINGPAGSTLSAWNFRPASAQSTALTQGPLQSFNPTESTTQATIATTDQVIIVEGVVVITVTGTMAIQARVVTSGTVTIKALSYIDVTESAGV